MASIKATRKFATLFLTDTEYRVYNRYAFASFAAGKVREAFEVNMEVQDELADKTSKLRYDFFDFVGVEGVDNITKLVRAKPVEDFNFQGNDIGVSLLSYSITETEIRIELSGNLRAAFSEIPRVIFHTQNAEGTKVEAQVMVFESPRFWKCINNLAVKDEAGQMIQFLVNLKSAGLHFELGLLNYFDNR